jgi:hypothetical protein
MSSFHDKRRKAALRPAEPVQVYLKADELGRLNRLTERLGATKSDVLRQGLEALERQLTDPATHPALGIIGLTRSQVRAPVVDAAREHDALLADFEVDSWSE